MTDFINPIDLIIFLILLGILAFGIKNGFLIEFKKTLNLFISTILTKTITYYLQKFQFITSETSSLLYFIILIILLFLIGFILDLIIYKIPQFSIEKNLDKTLGSLLSILKGLIIIAILIGVFESTPIQKNIKDKVFSKATSDSVLFNISNNLNKFLFN
jgi:uncharacterized membrane protein required for colicin V production